MSDRTLSWCIVYSSIVYHDVVHVVPISYFYARTNGQFKLEAWTPFKLVGIQVTHVSSQILTHYSPKRSTK